jgi:hypothetical protein
MTAISEDIIRQRAHAIWESQGKPEGLHLDHWEQARRELANGSSTPIAPVAAMAARAAEKAVKKSAAVKAIRKPRSDRHIPASLR